MLIQIINVSCFHGLVTSSFVPLLDAYRLGSLSCLLPRLQTDKLSLGLRGTFTCRSAASGDNECRAHPCFQNYEISIYTIFVFKKLSLMLYKPIFSSHIFFVICKSVFNASQFKKQASFQG